MFNLFALFMLVAEERECPKKIVLLTRASSIMEIVGCYLASHHININCLVDHIMLIHVIYICIIHL